MRQMSISGGVLYIGAKAIEPVDRVQINERLGFSPRAACVLASLASDATAENARRLARRVELISK